MTAFFCHQGEKLQKIWPFQFTIINEMVAFFVGYSFLPVLSKNVTFSTISCVEIDGETQEIGGKFT